MIRRGWLLAVSAGLGTALLPGCVRNWADHCPPYLLHDRPGLPPRVTVKPGPGEGVSPYGPRQTATAKEAPPEVLPPGVQEADILTPPPPSLPAPPGGAALTAAALPPEPAPGGSEASADPPEPWLAALRCYREDRPAAAAAHLEGYDPGRRELLASLLPLVARFGDAGEPMPGPRELSGVLDQLDRLAQALRPRAALAIDKMCFCRTVEGFGMYKPLPADYQFRAGADGRPGQPFQVYVELRNLTSRRHGPFHETVLACTLEILTYKHEVVFRTDGVWPDRRLSPCKDYFLNYPSQVPKDARPGPYILRVTVRDVTGLWDGKSPAHLLNVPAHRVARKTLDFRVALPGYVRRPGE